MCHTIIFLVPVLFEFPHHEYIIPFLFISIKLKRSPLSDVILKLIIFSLLILHPSALLQYINWYLLTYLIATDLPGYSSTTNDFKPSVSHLIGQRACWQAVIGCVRWWCTVRAVRDRTFSRDTRHTSTQQLQQQQKKKKIVVRDCDCCGDILTVCMHTGRLDVIRLTSQRRSCLVTWTNAPDTASPLTI